MIMLDEFATDGAECCKKVESRRKVVSTVMPSGIYLGAP